MTQKRFVVWKYIIDHNGHAFDMPAGARVLNAQMQGRNLVLWAAHDPDSTDPPQSRRFFIIGTGKPCEVDGCLYIGTAQDPVGFVWHIFEVVPEAVAPTAPAEARCVMLERQVNALIQQHNENETEWANEAEALRKTIDLALADANALARAYEARHKLPTSYEPPDTLVKRWFAMHNAAHPALVRAIDRLTATRNPDEVTGTKGGAT